MMNDDDDPCAITFESLPDEIVLNFLARISRCYYPLLSLVSKRFYSLLTSPGIYALRSIAAATEPLLHVCIWRPTTSKKRTWSTLVNTRVGDLRLKPLTIANSLAPLRFQATTVSVGFEIYQIGGSYLNYKTSKAVRVLDVRTQTWRRAPSLTVARNHAKSCFLQGNIYVVGGQVEEEEEEEESMMLWGEFFNLKTQTWKPLPSPSHLNVGNIHQVVVLGGRLVVITDQSNYAYDPIQQRWVQDVVTYRFVGIPKATCFVDNVMFADFRGKFKWYNSMLEQWFYVKNLDSLYAVRRGRRCTTAQLVNHGGKLLVIWDHIIKVVHPWTENKKIWCAVIRLETRFSDYNKTEIWGEVESCKILVHSLPEAYKMLCCLSISL